MTYFVNVSIVKEIEAAITKLPPADLAELRAWFEEFAAEEWDRQIEEDARNGKLDALYQRFEKENQHDGDLPLDDFINKEKLP